MDITTSSGDATPAEREAEAAFYRGFVEYLRDAYPAETPTEDAQAAAFRRVVAVVRQSFLGAGSAAAGDAAMYRRATAYMREHFRTATLADVAAAVGVSPFHFHRRFTLWAGRTPKQVMSELQVEHAKALLLDGKLDLPAVAERCGFAHQSHFTSRFKLLVGETPSRWRRARQVEALDAQYDDADADDRKAAA